MFLTLLLFMVVYGLMIYFIVVCMDSPKLWENSFF